MRRFNVRLFVILVVGFAVSGAVIQVLHAFQMHRQSGAFLREADRALQSGKAQEAADFFRTYLLLAPEDTQTMARLGQLLFDQRKLDESRAIFDQLVLRDQNNDDARRRLVDISLRLGRYQEAQSHLDPSKFLLKSHPDDGSLWFQLGTCQQGLRNYKLAAESFRKAIEKSPTLIAAYERLAEVLADRLGDGKAAVDVLDKMVNEKENRRRSDAYIARAKFIQSHVDDRLVTEAFLAIRGSSTGLHSRKTQEALRKAFANDADEALRLAPSDSRVLLFAARAALANGSVKEAKLLAERAFKQDPINAESYVMLAALELGEKRTKEATDWLTRGLRATGGPPVLLWTLANLRLETNDIQEAKKLVDRLRAFESARPIVKYLSARMLITESKWAEAAHQLEAVSGDLKRWPEMQKESQIWLARCDSRLGREDLAVGSYHAALEIDPDWTTARIGLAEALCTLGQIDQALVELRRLRQLPDVPPQSSIMLLKLIVLKTLDRPTSERGWTAIEGELNEVLKKHTSVDGIILKAEVQIGKGQLDEAVRTLRAAIAMDSKQLGLQSALISLMSRQENWNETERLLRDMQDRFGEGVALRLARADYLVRRYGISRKDELRSLANLPPTFSPSDRLNLAYEMGRLAAALQDYDQAQRLWRIVADAEPANLRIRLMLIDLAWQAGRTDDMEQPIAEIRSLEQNGPFSHYGEALRLTGLGKRYKDKAERTKDNSLLEQANALFDQADCQLDETRAQYPSWWKIPLLAAEISDIRGKSGTALENYLAAFNLGERSSLVINRLLGLLIEREENDKVEMVIRKLLREGATFSFELTSLVSQALVRTGDLSGALALARNSAAGSKDFRTAILLGQALSANGRLTEAETELRRATSLAPKEVSAWIALIEFYALNHNKDLTEKTATEALTKIDPKQAWVIQGYAYQLAGKMQEAESTYDAAMKKMPNLFQIRRLVIETKLQNRRVAEAESLLREFLASREASGNQQNVSWARRTLALSLAAAGTYPNYEKALELIDENLRDAPSSAVDRRVQAVIQASFPTPISHQRALQTLEKLAQLPKVLTPDDRIILARLYLIRGEWVKSSKVFREVVASSKNPGHIAAYVDALLGQKELGTADEWLRRLEELAPDEFVTADLRARLLAGQQHYGEAFDRIVAALSKGTSDTAARTAQRRIAAARLEDFGNELTRLKRDEEATRFLSQAEAYLSGSGGRPGNPSVDHLRFLVRRGRGAEALEEFDRLCERASAADVDQASMACASLRIEDRQLLNRLQRSIAQVAKQRPTYPVCVALATVQDRMGQYDDEEATYRRALGLDGTGIDALNNLAYLLAVRKKQLNEARLLVEKAITRAGPRTALLDTRAVVELAAGQSEAALADSEIAVSDVANPMHLFHQARVLLMNGRRDDARSSLNKALALGLASESLNTLEVAAFQDLTAQLEPPRR